MERQKDEHPAESREGRSLAQTLRQAFGSPGEELTQRVVHGGMWTAAEKVATRSVSLLKTVVLARLLAPEDFGLFGIALLTQATLDTLLRFGVDEALIQREVGAEGLLNAAWTVKVLKAVLVAGALLLSAPYVAAFFDAPGATPLIRVLAAVVMLQGLENIGVVYFRKELELRRLFALGFTSTLLNALVAITLAVVLGSVWALMAGIAAGAVAKLMLSYRLHPYRPNLEIERRKLGELWGFGKWLFGSSTLIYASTQVDDILLGRWLGAASLGVYQVAYRISNAVATEVTHVISGVTFPAYSKLQSQPDRLREGFLRTLSLTSLIVVPIAAAIVLFIPDFVRHVIGDKWSAAIGPVRILAVAGLVRAFSACWGPLYLAQARTEKPFWKQLIRVILTLGPAYPLTVSYGIEGMSLCVLAGIGAALAYDLWWSGTAQEMGIGVREVWQASAEPFLGTLVASAIVLSMQEVRAGSLVVFLILALVYSVAYGIAILWMERRGRSTGMGELTTLLKNV